MVEVNEYSQFGLTTILAQHSTYSYLKECKESEKKIGSLRMLAYTTVQYCIVHHARFAEFSCSGCCTVLF